MQTPWEKLEELEQGAKLKIEGAQSIESLEEARIALLGKKGVFAGLMVFLKELSAEEKPLFGAKVNELKSLCETLLSEKAFALSSEILSKRLATEWIDVTLPGRKLSLGQTHPISAFIEEAGNLLMSMGFSPQVFPEVDSSYYNYEGLNFPPEHPARDMQDTFYLSSDMLLRSHNTTFWQHLFEEGLPPIRAFHAGKVFRNEEVSGRSHVVFHQIDVLYVDEKVSFSDLLGTMKTFFSRLFGQELNLRLRPSYFPFVEPGVEVDLSCILCQGKGCSLCKHSGWLEIAGAGLVHPNALREGGIDPDRYSGIAWGMGVERTLMLKAGIDDLRLFWNNHDSFLKQFVR